MEVSNECMVGVQGDQIVIMFPKSRLSKDAALMFAAWIVVLADPAETRFKEILEAVQNT